MARLDPPNLGEAARLVRECADAGTGFRYEDDMVHFEGNKRVSTDVKARLRSMKPAVIDIIQARLFARAFASSIGQCHKCRRACRTVGEDLRPWHPLCWEKENSGTP